MQATERLDFARRGGRRENGGHASGAALLFAGIDRGGRGTIHGLGDGEISESCLHRLRGL